ncbi:hypothetical protein [Pseudomonas yamanorum]|uniref:hypothetical protein n=1 Tax=Pseudomonas yamanorum TaxID=515393 RepID=UPI003B9E6A3E
MQLHEVEVIKELFKVREVNEALTDGWRIVAVVSSVNPENGNGLPVACYVLGRKAKKEQPKMPSAADLARANSGL